MRGRRQTRVALILWAAFAFVTWNVVFDRYVYLAGVAFIEEQIDRHQRGAPVRSIDEAFSPRVREAAVHASAWSAVVLTAGIILIRRPDS